MRASEILTELFDPKAGFDLKWDAGSSTEQFATAYDRQGRAIDISFIKSEGLWDIEFERDGAMDITGGGDAERVFATVINAIKIFVDKVKPEFIVFSAKEPSRQSLYKALANRVGRQIGYKLYPLDFERAMAITGSKSLANILARNSADGSMLLLKRGS